ncbi:3-phosphoshikimate 1-carboxyvinyltransferase [Lutispora saccharofermentans]|uniref:3-phosphoshikimate 1-carboxyvinyltransferase n=1 Tax=Lutispora saccharofermentans TaxID=3024236 RepID=A0ABT1NJ59_9FIRM|nr:3-phosphoshikimate 1-carboxyvinyltransferase [Lutispora saccharofermentans]MCQ1531302.1 3-phosphoshikimate 1-carboxyvinyltransferase [Lutispora saccharofermentans]
MKSVKIMPSKLRGTINVPPSKSMAHRVVICGGLGAGKSSISNIDLSDDLTATIEGMRALGSEIEKSSSGFIINGAEFLDNANAAFTNVIDCNESGTTLRLLIPISLTKENSVVFTGRGNLGKRPLDLYYEIFEKHGISYEYEKDGLNLKIKGSMKPGEYKIRGDISSQFISGLLLALPLLDGDSKITVTTDMESRGYIDLTIDMQKRFGIDIQQSKSREFYIKGRQIYKPTDYAVEGDFSQGAFYLVAGALGNDIKCKGLNIDSLQGDKAVLGIIEAMGGKVETKGGYIQAYGADTQGTVIDGSQFPDIIPILAVLGALSRGTTKIVNAGRLRIKECDRLKAICEGLRNLGADIRELEDGLIINGRKSLDGGIADSWNDHRIAMSLAIASTRCKDAVTIRNSHAVKKSYPGFWNDFKSLGGNADEWNMG